MGWHGRILNVDLTAGTCEEEALNREWADAYLGQRGLGSKYLMERMDAKADALSPENVLIFATGPLTGTAASTSGRYSVITKGALTDAIACSNSGGFFGAELKFAGWDMIIVKGRAEHPVYLNIQNNRAELLDARDFIWGCSVWETEQRLHARHQDPLLRIASIGVAGEKLARYACIVNDRDRAAGRSGVGAVMGSKNLKAVAVRGTKGVTVDDSTKFLQAVTETRAKLDHSPTQRRLSKYGTMAMMDVTNSYGSLPTRNNRDVQFEGIAKVNVKAMHEVRKSDGKANLVGNKACFGCTLACGRVAKIRDDHFSVQGKKDSYRKAIGGLEYESGFALAPWVGVDDIEAATYANMICNEQGLDPISFGGTVAAAMELYEIGAITKDDTGGMDFSFGNAEALVMAADLVGTGDGFGADLGLGAKRLCQKYGHPELAMVVKGQEFPGYDGRAMQGMALAFATSPRGACHMKASPYTDDFTHVRPEGKAEIVMTTQNKAAIVDSTGLCAFPGGTWDLNDYAKQVDGACAGDWDEARMMETGERIFNLERLFNLRAGLTAGDDTLPDRILKEAAKSGAGKGRVAELDKMLPEYYQRRGWSDAGVPEKTTLERLGLD